MDRTRSHPGLAIDIGGPMAHAGGVQEQIAHGRRPSRRSRRTVGLEDDDTSELWQVLLHRVVQREAPLFEQHQHGDGRHRLGHRVDAEERALRHRGARREVLVADGGHVREAAVAREHRDRPRHATFIHEAAQHGGRLLEGGRFQPCRSRRGAWQRIAAGLGRHGDRCERERDDDERKDARHLSTRIRCASLSVT